MMAIPANLTSVVLRGTFITPEGDPSTGTISFTPSSWLINSGANVSIPNSTITKTLGTAGDFEVTLPVTDDADVSPGDWVYSVSEVVDGVSQNYNILLPGTVGGTAYLADIAPAAAAGPEYYSLASSLTIGTVTNVGAGGTPTASITGTAPNQTLDLGIPQGLQGLPGSLAEVGVQQFAADGSVLANLPAQVPSAERLLKQAVWWIDAAHSSASGQSVSNLGWGGTALAAQLGSTTGADSNDPKYLDWSGENYVYLPGVAGNNLSVPDEAALDITGDIDIRVHVAMDDWTPADTNDLCGKLTTSGDQRSWYFRLLTTGDLQLAWSTDGTFGTLGAVNSTASVTAVDGDALWLRVTLDVDNGSSQHEVKFYTSDDGSSWTQLGSTRVTSGTTSIFSSTSPFRLGARGDIGGIAPGKFYRAQVLNGIDGTPVLDVDCSQITSGSATTFAALTGQTVTINRSTSGRKSVAVTHPCWLFGTDDYMEVADNDLIDFGASDSFTVLAVVRAWATPVTNGRFIAKDDNFTSDGWCLRYDGTNYRPDLLVKGTNPVETSSTVSQTLGALLVFTGLVDRSAQVARVYSNTTAGSNADISTVGALSNSLPMRVGVRSNAVSTHNDFEFIAAAIFRRALTSDEISTLTAYFQGRAI